MKKHTKRLLILFFIFPIQYVQIIDASNYNFMNTALDFLLLSLFSKVLFDHGYNNGFVEDKYLAKQHEDDGNKFARHIKDIDNQNIYNLNNYDLDYFNYDLDIRAFDNGIFTYNRNRDRDNVIKMIRKNLSTTGSENFSIAKMLDYNSYSVRCKDGALLLRVFRKDGQAVGFISCYQKSPDDWHIHQLVVDENHRREGIGESLLKFVIEQARSYKAKKMTIYVLSSNDAAQKLYKKSGFQYVSNHSMPPEIYTLEYIFNTEIKRNV